jgi:hypothetical protein
MFSTIKKKIDLKSYLIILTILSGKTIYFLNINNEIAYFVYAILFFGFSYINYFFLKDYQKKDIFFYINKNNIYFILILFCFLIFSINDIFLSNYLSAAAWLFFIYIFFSISLYDNKELRKSLTLYCYFLIILIVITFFLQIYLFSFKFVCHDLRVFEKSSIIFSFMHTDMTYIFNKHQYISDKNELVTYANCHFRTPLIFSQSSIILPFCLLPLVFQSYISGKKFFFVFFLFSLLVVPAPTSFVFLIIGLLIFPFFTDLKLIKIYFLLLLIFIFFLIIYLFFNTDLQSELIRLDSKLFHSRVLKLYSAMNRLNIINSQISDILVFPNYLFGIIHNNVNDNRTGSLLLSFFTLGGISTFIICFFIFIKKLYFLLNIQPTDRFQKLQLSLITAAILMCYLVSNTGFNYYQGLVMLLIIHKILLNEKTN